MLVEPEVWALIQNAFKREFGGWSPLGTTAVEGQGGEWVDPETNEEVEDVCMYVRVYVESGKIDNFKRLVTAIGKQLEQKQMLIDIEEVPTGEFLKIFDGGLTDDEQLLLFGEEVGDDERDERDEHDGMPPSVASSE